MEYSIKVQSWYSILIITFISLISSCEKSKINMDITDQVQFPDSYFFGVCFSGLWSKGYDEIIITDNQSFQIFGNSIRINIYNMDCQSVDLPFIDFSKYSLIGKYTCGGGCSVEHTRQIIDDKFNNKLIYKIKDTYYGDCELFFISMNWAIIPKLDSEYKIEFQVE